MGPHSLFLSPEIDRRKFGAMPLSVNDRPYVWISMNAGLLVLDWKFFGPIRPTVTTVFLLGRRLYRHLNAVSYSTITTIIEVNCDDGRNDGYCGVHRWPKDLQDVVQSLWWSQTHEPSACSSNPRWSRVSSSLSVVRPYLIILPSTECTYTYCGRPLQKLYKQAGYVIFVKLSTDVYCSHLSVGKHPYRFVRSNWKRGLISFQGCIKFLLASSFIYGPTR